MASSQDREQQLVVGIVGTGVGIRTHLVGLAAVPGVRVGAVVGSSVEAARRHLENAGAAPALASDLDGLLALDPDLICLTTPPLERGPFVEALTASKAALLVEKPVGIDYATAEPLLAPVRDGRPAFTNLQLRGLPAFGEIRERVAAGELGTVYSLRAEEKTAAFRGDAIPGWQARRSSGGGQRLAMGPHLLDLALYLLDANYEDVARHERAGRGQAATPRGAWAQAVARAHPADVADETFRASFGTGTCWIDLFTTSLTTGPRTLKIELDGTEGVMRFRFVDGVGIVDVSTATGRERLAIATDGSLVPDGTPERLNPSVFRIAYPAYAARLVDALRDGGSDPGLASLEDGLANLSLLDWLIDGDDA